MFVKITSVLFASLALAQALPSSKFTCPEGVETVAEFYPDKYLGEWYTTYSNINFFNQEGDNCIQASYKPLNETAVYAKNVGYTPEGEYEQICGIGFQVDPVGAPGKLKVDFGVGKPGDYWVLDTDYDNFSVVYSCSEIFGQITQAIITRTNNPTDAIVELGFEALRRNGIDTSGLVKILHEDCLYDNPEQPKCDFEYQVEEFYN